MSANLEVSLFVLQSGIQKSVKSFSKEVPFRSRPVCRTGVCAGATLIFAKIEQLVLSGDILKSPSCYIADTRRLLLEGQRHLSGKITPTQRKREKSVRERQLCGRPLLFKGEGSCDSLGVCISIGLGSHPRCKKQSFFFQKN